MAAQPGNRGFHVQRRKTALERFAERCAFDPFTGCVMWIGGTTSGHGNHAPYGSFWDGKRWFAHRWAARHIHGLDIDGAPVGHVCPHGPHTLCVQHVAPTTVAENNTMKTLNPGRCDQGVDARRHWIYVQVGLVEYEPPPRIVPDVPYYEPPDWLRPFLPVLGVDCPF